MADEESKPKCLNAEDITDDKTVSPTKQPSDGDVKSQDEQPKQEDAKMPTSMVGGWFSSLVATAKQTVNKTTMESIKRDLNEFRAAVQNDSTMNMVYSTASSLVKEIGNSVTEISSLGADTDDPGPIDGKKNDDQPKVAKDDNEKQKEKEVEEEEGEESLDFDQMKSTLGQWTNRLTDTARSTITRVKDTLVSANSTIFSSAIGAAEFPVDELDEEPFVVKNGDIIKIENWKELLHQLQIDSDTYCREPTGTDDDYDRWLERFNLINYQRQTEYLLETVPEIKKFHKQLVPETLTESDFWHRYFYKVHQLKLKEANKIVGKSENSTNTNATAAASAAISRSSTTEDGWEKMSTKSGSETERQSTKSSDDDRDWVKCD